MFRKENQNILDSADLEKGTLKDRRSAIFDCKIFNTSTSAQDNMKIIDITTISIPLS